MKTLLTCSLSVLFFCLTSTTEAQTWQWAKNLHGPNQDQVLTVETDNFGHIYVGGQFRDTLRFSSTNFLVATPGSFDGFFAKYDDQGNVQWSKKFGGNAIDAAHSIAIDSTGNLYIAGYSRSTNTVTYGSFSFTGTGNDKTFILKTDSTGTLIWGKLVTAGTSNAYPKQIAVNNSGTVGLIGNYAFLNLSIESTTLTLAGSEDIFVASYNSTNGNFNWATSINGQYQDYGHSIKIDENNNIYYSGYGNSPLTFAGTYTAPFTAGYETFVAKLNANGTHGWAKRYAGIGDDICDGLVLSPSGHLYTAGYFNAGNRTLNDTTFTILTVHNMYVQKLDLQGNSDWTKIYSGNPLGRIGGIATDPASNVWIAGYLGSCFNFDTTQLCGSSTDYTKFLVKIDPWSNTLFAVKGGNKVNNGSIDNLAVDPLQNGYIVGYYGSTGGEVATFGTHTITNQGSNDGFLAKVNTIGFIPCTVTAQFTAATTYCDGDTLVALNTSSNATNYQWKINNVLVSTASTLVYPGISGMQSTVTLIATGATCSDSVSQTLTGNQSHQFTLPITKCAYDSVVFNGQTIFSAGTYDFHLTTVNGCDSNFTFVINNHPTTTLDSLISLCDGDNYILPNGAQFFTNQTYTYTYLNGFGCYDTTHYTFNFIGAQNTFLSDTICLGETYNFNGTLLSNSGTYADTLISSVVACDSIVVLYLEVLTFDNSLSQTTTYLKANQLGDSYQWLTCDGTIVPNETNQTFYPTQTGSYKAEVNYVMCTDTTVCSFFDTGLEEIKTQHFSVYPNPTAGNFTVNSPTKISKIMVYNSLGVLVFSLNSSPSNTLTIEEQFAPGVYVVAIETNSAIQQKVLIVR